MRKFKEFIAVAMTGTMMLGLCAPALAVTGTATGTDTGTGAGSYEGYVDKDVIAVTLPATDTTTFAYIADPNGLIKDTDAAKYGDATFEDGASVFFQNTAKTYSSTSNKLKVINKGSVDVDVTISASIADHAKVTVAASSAFSGTNKDLYMGLVVADQAEAAVVSAGNAGTAKTDVSVGLRGCADNFEVSYDTDSNAYEFAQKSNVKDTAWNSFEFYVKGACNEAAAWDATDTMPTMTITWAYAQRAGSSQVTLLDANATSDAAPSIATTSYQMAKDTPIDVNVDLGAGDLAATTVSAVKYGEFDVLGATVAYDAVAKKLTVTAQGVNDLIGIGGTQKLTVVFNDTAATTVELTLTPATP